MSHEMFAIISGFNNNQEDYCLNDYQEEQKTGRWRWILPSIVTVVLLGDLSTMRRWFGGAGVRNSYQLPSGFVSLEQPNKYSAERPWRDPEIRGCKPLTQTGP